MNLIAIVVAALGGWIWWVVGLLLLLLELVVPGVYFLWLAIAAFAVGASSLVVDWTWQWQIASFAALSVISVVLARIFFSSSPITSDHPLLNRRAEALVGRHFVLDEPLVNGRGRVRVGDTLWLASGPDMPSGTKVTVASVREGVLEIVQAADA